MTSRNAFAVFTMRSKGLTVYSAKKKLIPDDWAKKDPPLPQAKEYREPIRPVKSGRRRGGGNMFSKFVFCESKRGVGGAGTRLILCPKEQLSKRLMGSSCVFGARKKNRVSKKENKGR